MRQQHWYGVTITRRDGRPDDPPPVPPTDADAQLQRAQYELETARAESTRIKRDLDEIRKQLPTDEQRARYAEMEAAFQKAEEDRLKKAGEFDAWRQQIQAKNDEQLSALRTETQNALALAGQHEKELNDTLIGLAFSGATDWFGPTGKTVLIPEVAQSYFARSVEIEVVPSPSGGKASRRVVVRDANGTVIVDPRSGKPMPFSEAIGELITAHPQRQQFLRGSGKVGSGSTGGTGGADDIDLSKLKAADFHDPKVRERLRDQQTASGGMQVGPAFDRINRARNSK